MEQFSKYKLCKEIIKSLDLLNFKEATNVQDKVIPLILDNKNVIIKSQTGSGKTASFGIPICELIEWEEFKPQALVIVPTRELALQVKEDLFNIGRFKRMKVVSVFGKSPMSIQEKELKQKTHIVVGTPGRIIDLEARKTLDLSNIKYLIIDEADKILNMGFIEQLDAILSVLPTNKTSILLSATYPEGIKKITNKYIKQATTVEIEDTNKTKTNIIEEMYRTKETDKIKLLKDLTIVENPDSCILFCNTKQKVDTVFDELEKALYPVKKIHGGMEQSDRTSVMEDFKRGKFRYLVATDVAARGIDIEDISLVINYDIPVETENYVHRIGRTGRIGKIGKAVTFVTPFEDKFLKAIINLRKIEIIEKDIPSKELVSSLKNEFKEKIYKNIKIKKEKGSNLNKEILKIHINAGKKTKMRAVDIVGTICSIDNVDKDDIGIIEIRDISTYVEILNNKGEIVFKELQDKQIKGRNRRVSKVEDSK